MDAEVKAVCAEAAASAPPPTASVEKHARVLTLTAPRRELPPVAVLCVSGTPVSAVPPPKAA